LIRRGRSGGSNRGTNTTSMSICVIFARIVFKTLLGGAPHRTLADGFVTCTEFVRVLVHLVSKILQ